MSNYTSIAVIADVHANSLALDAVLQDIQSRRVDQIINLGDSVYGPLEPGITAERLMRPDVISISGNMDRLVVHPEGTAPSSPTMQFVLDSLTSDQKAWLDGLPNTHQLGDVFCCHGTPDSDETSLLENITPSGVFLADTEAIAAALANVDASVILCGHTHVPRTVWLPDGRLVVNPGSVGMPAYDHDAPYPHRMEAGSPHARYAILSKDNNRWSVEHIAVPYDWDRAALTAQKNGREDYAFYIRHGRGGWKPA